MFWKGTALKSNLANDGREFEATIQKVADQYNRLKILRLHKVEPPCRIIGWGPNTRVIWLENTFGDFIGSWTARAGRTLMIEVKSTREPQLPIRTDSSLRPAQITWLKRWHYSGAAVGVLWHWLGHGVVFLPIGLIQSIYQGGAGRKHIRFEEGDLVTSSPSVDLDFVKNIEKYYPHDL